MACDKNNLIGINNRIPWNSKNDMRFFKYITTKVEQDGMYNVLIVGRKTFEGMPINKMDCTNRRFIIMSRQKNHKTMNSCILGYIQNIDEYKKYINKNVNKIFIIGGKQVYEHALNSKKIDILYRTTIQGSVKVPHNEKGVYFNMNIECSEKEIIKEYPDCIIEKCILSK